MYFLSRKLKLSFGWLAHFGKVTDAPEHDILKVPGYSDLSHKITGD